MQWTVHPVWIVIRGWQRKPYTGRPDHLHGSCQDWLAVFRRLQVGELRIVNLGLPAADLSKADPGGTFVITRDCRRSTSERSLDSRGVFLELPWWPEALIIRAASLAQRSAATALGQDWSLGKDCMPCIRLCRARASRKSPVIDPSGPDGGHFRGGFCPLWAQCV